MFDEEQINQAIKAVSSGRMSLRGAARKFDLVSNPLSHGLDYGNKSMVSGHENQMHLTLSEEYVLLSWIFNQDSMGHTPTDEAIKQEACRIAQSHGRNITPGKSWPASFRRRHRCLEYINERKQHRTKTIDPHSLKNFYNNVETMIGEFDVKPENMYIMDMIKLESDESYTQENSTSSSRKSKTCTTAADPTGSPVIFIECICAIGSHINPAVIFTDSNAKTDLYKPRKSRHAPDWLYFNTTND